MFEINQMVFYKDRGLFVVKRIETKNVSGKSKDFYILYGVETQMTMLFPCDTATAQGVRPLVSKEKAKQVIEFLQSGTIEIDEASTWNRRYRDYMEKLALGDIDETAKVLLALRGLRQVKDLSFGERKMVDRAKTSLDSELGEVLGTVEYSNTATLY